MFFDLFCSFFLPYFLLASPLLATLFTAFFSSQLNRNFKFHNFLIFLGFLSSFALLFARSKQPTQTVLFHVFTFLNLEHYTAYWAINLDNLSLIMITMVYFVSLMVHIYSLAYMQEERDLRRFFAYISLFTFFMILLVASDNLVQLFVGWEGVGACSYLLIGYWTTKDSATRAAYKAFIVNRIGDACFVMAMIILAMKLKTLDISAIETYLVADLNSYWVVIVALLLLIGAMTKSAQIGFHVWLPDAMEGPTPVSALIHAATMVTAGIFLLSRMHFIYSNMLVVSCMIGLIGSATAIICGMIAVTQYDIKKIVAYSTCSQLGLMFVAIGCRGYHLAIFHLLTHAFFKALMFLGAGSVIYGLHHQQDIRKMGNIGIKMPLTALVMLLAGLAISGIYPLAGYYSKDAIVESAFAVVGSYGNNVWMARLATIVAWGTFVAANLTALYTFRLFFVVFGNKYRGPDENYHHVHESPWIMQLPMLLLGILSFIAGSMGVKWLHLSSYRGDNFLSHSMPVNLVPHATNHLIEYATPIVSSCIIVICFFYYHLKEIKVMNFYNRIPEGLRLFLYNKCYFDEMYSFLVTKPFSRLVASVGKWDNYLLESFFRLANFSFSLSRHLKTYIVGSIDINMATTAIIICLGMLFTIVIG